MRHAIGGEVDDVQHANPSPRIASSGMSSHGSNGLGLENAITGDLIVVLGSSIGAVVDRSCTLLVTLRPAGVDCHTTTTAVTSAHRTPNSLNLVAMTSPPLGCLLFAQALIAAPLPGV